MKCPQCSNTAVFDFYARKQLLLSARLSHRNSVRLYVCSSVRHTGGSVKNGGSPNFHRRLPARLWFQKL